MPAFLIRKALIAKLPSMYMVNIKRKKKKEGGDK